MADTNALIGTQLKTFPGGEYNSNASHGSYTIDEASDKGAVIFQVPEDCDITGMTAWFLHVQSPPAYKYTLQGVDASGNPDGVVKATTAEFTPTASAIHAVAYTSAYTASQGELLAGVWEYSSGTISSSNDARARSFIKTVRYHIFPYWTYYNGSAWVHDSDSYPTFALQTDEDWDAGGIFNTGPAAQTVSSSGHRFAQRVLIPADEDIELHVNGFDFTGDTAQTAGDEFKVALWDASGTELASATIDTGQQGAWPHPTDSRQFTFTADGTISAGSIFYIGFECTGDTLTLDYAQPLGADGLKSWPGGAVFYASYWNGSSWADDLPKRLCLNPILSSFHGTGGGGGGSTTGATMGVIG